MDPQNSKTSLHYKDNSIVITDHDITIYNYYFPLGQPKIIPWGEIKSISIEPLTFLNGKYRVWGTGLRPYWFHSDWRADKDRMFVIDTGSVMKAAITPDDFEAAKRAIEAHVAIRQ